MTTTTDTMTERQQIAFMAQNAAWQTMENAYYDWAENQSAETFDRSYAARRTFRSACLDTLAAFGLEVGRSYKLEEGGRSNGWGQSTVVVEADSTVLLDRWGLPIVWVREVGASRTGWATVRQLSPA